MLEEPGSGHYKLELKLAFDMNAAAAIQEKTAEPRTDFRGYLLTDFYIWSRIGEPKLLKAMFWAALLAHQPEYDSAEGFDTAGTFIQENNAQQIVDALETAYYAFLPKDKAEKIQKIKAEVEAKAKGEGAETESPLDQTKAPTPAETTGLMTGPSLVTTSVSTSTSSAG